MSTKIIRDLVNEAHTNLSDALAEAEDELTDGSRELVSDIITALAKIEDIQV